MIEKAQSAELRNALESHLEETRGHVSRLEQVFEMHGEEAKKQKCKGMQGVLEEGDEMVGKDATPVVRDAAIISACRRVEHYEIAAYGTVRTYAEQMGQQRAAAVLQETLDRKSLDQANLKEVSVSQDRDKGVVTLGGRVATDGDKSQAESLAKSIAGGQGLCQTRLQWFRRAPKATPKQLTRIWARLSRKTWMLL